MFGKKRNRELPVEEFAETSVYNYVFSLLQEASHRVMPGIIDKNRTALDAMKGLSQEQQIAAMEAMLVPMCMDVAQALVAHIANKHPDKFAA